MVMKRLFSFILLSAFILIGNSLALCAREYNPWDFKIVNQLTVEHGISDNTVSCILQDSKGFIWVGTWDGLNRFDGYTFEIYKPEPGNPYSISSGAVTSLLQDRERVLWVGTANGLNKYDRQRNRFVRFRNNPDDPYSLNANSVGTIYEDNAGVLWVGTKGGGLNKFDREKEQFIHFKYQSDDPYSLSHNNVRAILEDRWGVLWVGTLGGGLNKYDRQRARFVHYKNNPNDPYSLSNNNVMSIYADKSDALWIGTENGLNRFDRAKEQFIHYKSQPGYSNIATDKIINPIYQDPTGALWIGTGNGLSLLDQEEGYLIPFKRSLDSSGSLGNNGVNAIYQSSQGLLWLGTYGGGVKVLDRVMTRFKHYRSIPYNPDSLSSNIVSSIYEDPSGILWVGTWGGGLNKIDRKTNTFTHYQAKAGDPNSLINNDIKIIRASRNGLLWIGTWGKGLDKFDPVTETFTHYQHNPNQPSGLDDNFIQALCVDRTGMLWIGTRRGGINKLDPETGTFTYYKISPPRQSILDYPINVIFEDQSGVLWIGATGSGIHTFDPQKKSFTLYKKMPYVPICLNSSASVLWIGTRGGGLKKLEIDKKRLSSYTMKDGLPNDTVYGILKDSQGNLWLSTSKGVSKFNPGQGTFKNYGVKDGLQGFEFNTNAHYKNPGTGEMFFGGINGFNSFYPDRIKDNAFIPPVVITAFKKFNRPVVFDTAISELKEIRLPQKENFFSFEFAALNYRNPELNQYAYKLEGFDKEWVHSGSRRYASYTNLSGGTYEFHVIGSNDDGVWNEKGTSIKIVILPPFWQTTWFYLLVLAAILLVIYLLYRLRIGKIEARKVKLEELVQERTKEAERERRAAEAANRIKSDFLACMSHEIRTPMNAILGFTEMVLDTNLNEEQRDYLQTVNRSSESLLTLLNDILDFSKIESGQLSLESIDFDPEAMAFDVCGLMQPRIENKPVQILCRIHDNVPSHVKGDPGRYRQVVVNLMENAVKFTGNGEIELSINVEAENESAVTLRTTVRDTGKGIPADKQEIIFNAFRQADGSITREYGGSGLGLAICKQISKLMGGDIWVKSEPGKGSTFYFTTVLQKADENSVKPLLKPKPGAMKTRHSIIDAAKQSIRILLVEDNPINRKLANFLLTRAGYQVETANNGKEAVTTYTANPDKFDMILMDVQMPEMDGKEATRKIRGQGFHEIPIIAVTAQAMKGDREKCLEAGMNDYISKPIKREVVFEMVKKWTVGEGKK